jgi:deoxycytidylate deaminase
MAWGKKDHNVSLLQEYSKLLPIEKQDWTTTFFLKALAGTVRADCTRRQFGCIAVSPEKRVLATGYNSPPVGVDSAVQRYQKVRHEEWILSRRHSSPKNPENLSVNDFCAVPKGFMCCKENGEPAGSSYDACNAMHAEANCLTFLGHDRANQYEYIDLYIAGRNGQTGDLVDSKPCIYCSRIIRSFPNVREIHCLMSNGTEEVLVLKDLEKTLTA